MSDVINVGVVAYDPKVVTIWEGIKEYFTARGIAMDFVLFSNYDAQCDALLDGWIDIAWNTNLAYIKIHRRTGGRCGVLAMRDVDVVSLLKLLPVRKRVFKTCAISKVSESRSAAAILDKPRFYPSIF